MAEPGADKFFLLEINEDRPAVLGEQHFTHSDIEGIFLFETPTPTATPRPRPSTSLPFAFDADSDHNLAGLSPPRSAPWGYILDSTNTNASVPGGGGSSGTGGGQEDLEVLGLIRGFDCGDASIFSVEPPSDQGPGLDDIFMNVQWEQVLPDPPVFGAPPAAQAAVEGLDLVEISEKEQECAVCKDELEQGTLATRLPCDHFFHVKCIQSWLALRNSCPVCSFQLPTDDPNYEEKRARRHSAGGSSSSAKMI